MDEYSHEIAEIWYLLMAILGLERNGHALQSAHSIPFRLPHINDALRSMYFMEGGLGGKEFATAIAEWIRLIGCVHMPQLWMLEWTLDPIILRQLHWPQPSFWSNMARACIRLCDYVYGSKYLNVTRQKFILCRRNTRSLLYNPIVFHSVSLFCLSRWSLHR